MPYSGAHIVATHDLLTGDARLWSILTCTYSCPFCEWSLLTSIRLGHENSSPNIDETFLCGHEWSKTGTHVETDYKSSITLIYLCQGDVQKPGVFPFGTCFPGVSRAYFQRVPAWGKPYSAACDVMWNARGDSTSEGVCLRGEAANQTRPSGSFYLAPEYYLAATEMENSIDYNRFS